MYEYVEVLEEIEGEVFDKSYVKYTDPDGMIWTIPNDPKNPDYQAYLLSLEEE